MTLFLLYKWSFAVAFLSALILPYIGSHLVPRKKTLEIFVLCQLALVGNLLARLAFDEDYEFWHGVSLSALFYVVGQRFFVFGQKRISWHPEQYIALYVALLCGQFLLIGLFPGLDAHTNTGFFGDIVTATDSENIFLVIVLSIWLYLNRLYRMQTSKNTLEICVFGHTKNDYREDLLFVVPVVLCLYGLGFIYTIGFLSIGFVFTQYFSGPQSKSLNLVLFLAVLSALLGLSMSLIMEQFSTTPTQVVLFGGFTVVCSSLHVLWFKA